MAEYFGLDPTLVRVLWILSVFFGGFTILVYIIMAFVVPPEPAGMHGFGAWQPTGPSWGQTAGPGAWQAAGTAGPGAWQTGPSWGPPSAQPFPTPGAGPTPTAGDAGAPEATAEGATAGVTEGIPAGAGIAAEQTGASGPYATGSYWGWQAPVQRVDRQPGRAGLYLGVLFVVMGALAMVGTLFPTWIGARHIVPAFIVAIGIVLLVASVRRSSSDQPASEQ